MKEIIKIPPTNPAALAPSPTPSQAKHVLPMLLILLVLLTGVLIALIFYFDQIFHTPLLQYLTTLSVPKQTNERFLPRVVVPRPSPTPSYLPPGKQTYTISQNNTATGPHIATLTLDPLDAHKNQQQQITVSSENPLTSVSIKIDMDNSVHTMPLLKQNGSWTATWTLSDSVNTRYIYVITATDNTGTSKIIVTPRSPGAINNNELY